MLLLKKIDFPLSLGQSLLKKKKHVIYWLADFRQFKVPVIFFFF